MPTAASTRLGLVAPLGADAVALGDDVIRTIVSTIDPLVLIWLTGTLAARPAASLAGRVYKATDNNGLYLDLGSSWLTIVAPTVSALPGSPQDGDRVNYVADATNGIIWPLVYRAADATTRKWNVLGQPAPLYSEIVAQETTASTSDVALTTAGPSITVPLLGDYDVKIEALMGNQSGGGAVGSVMGYTIGGVAMSINDTIQSNGNPTTVGSPIANVEGTRRQTNIAAATAFVANYRTTSSGTSQFARRRMLITPVRVG